MTPNHFTRTLTLTLNPSARIALCSRLGIMANNQCLCIQQHIKYYHNLSWNMVLLAGPARRLLPPRSPVLRKPHGVRHYSIQAVIEHGCSGITDYVDLLPVACMEAVHSTGLPWFAAIPISAVLIRSLFVYPLFQRPLRDKLVNRAQIQPLQDARMSVNRRTLNRTIARNKPVNRQVLLIAQSWKTRISLQASLFDQVSFGHRFMMFLTTIWVSDSLRKLMGAKDGLLKFVLGPLDWTLSWLVPSALTEANPQEALKTASANSAPAQVTTQASIDRFQFPTGDQAIQFPTNTKDFWTTAETAQIAAQSAAQDAATHVAPETSTAVADHVNSVWFDPTLLTEGLSWCPDLTACDPTMILPILFSSSFFASIYFAPRIQGAASTTGTDSAPERAKPTNMQRIMMTIAMLSIIPALKMPAGLLLYFLSNMIANNFMSRWLAYTRPIHPAPTACKRPVRMQRFKEIAEDVLPNATKPTTKR
jgi:inner membrane protein COX18